MGTLTFFLSIYTKMSKAKAETVDITSDPAKKKIGKGLKKRLSKTKPVPTEEEVKDKLDKAGAARDKATTEKVAKAKVDIDGAKAKASTDQAKADKAKGDKESSEMKTKSIPNDS